MQIALRCATTQQFLSFHEQQWLHAIDPAAHPWLAQLLRAPRGGVAPDDLPAAMDALLACLADQDPADTVVRRSGLRLLLWLATGQRQGQPVSWQHR
ncbi:hypothetical protein [Stenotrophomonas rhizophila]